MGSPLTRFSNFASDHVRWIMVGGQSRIRCWSAVLAQDVWCGTSISCWLLLCGCLSRCSHCFHAHDCRSQNCSWGWQKITCNTTRSSKIIPALSSERNSHWGVSECLYFLCIRRQCAFHSQNRKITFSRFQMRNALLDNKLGIAAS
jgi:hypothetical protein